MPLLQPAGHRMVHDKLTANPVFCQALRALAVRFRMSLSPCGNGSMTERSSLMRPWLTTLRAGCAHRFFTAAATASPALMSSSLR